MQKRIIQTYKAPEDWVKGPPGIGDFIRGACHLFEMLDGAGVEFRIDISRTEFFDLIEYDESIFQIGDAEKIANAALYFVDHAALYQRIVEFLKSQEADLYICTNLGAWNRMELPHKTRDFIRKFYRFNGVVGRLSATVLKGRTYEMLTIRCGQFDDEQKGSLDINAKNQILSIIENQILPNAKFPIVVASDSHQLKCELAEKYGFILFPHQTKHGAYGGGLPVVTDLFLLKNSKFNYHINVWASWWSGFSHYTSIIFNIPGINFRAPHFTREEVKKKKTLVIDAVIFQFAENDITRMWGHLLELWSASDFAGHVVIIDRAGTAPRCAGLHYRDVPCFDYKDVEGDRQRLQSICDEENADLFISTHYTRPTKTKAALLVSEMLPEVMGMDRGQPEWMQKTQAIQYAKFYIALSKNIAGDLIRYSNKSKYDLALVPCGCGFSQPPTGTVEAFKAKYGILKPYFMLSGSQGGYKNGILFFAAFSKFAGRRGEFSILCIGGDGQLESSCLEFVGDASVFLLGLNDEEMQAAYAGALALVDPSLYVGFGFAPLEAMACGCPVITGNGALTELCGDAALYVDIVNAPIENMYIAINSVLDPQLRDQLVSSGLKQSARFLWEKTAVEIAGHLKKWAGFIDDDIAEAEGAGLVDGGALPGTFSLRDAVGLAFEKLNAGDLSGVQAICDQLLVDKANNFYVYYLAGIVASSYQSWALAKRRFQQAMEVVEDVPADRIADASLRLEAVARAVQS